MCPSPLQEGHNLRMGVEGREGGRVWKGEEGLKCSNGVTYAPKAAVGMLKLVAGYSACASWDACWHQPLPCGSAAAAPAGSLGNERPSGAPSRVP